MNASKLPPNHSAGVALLSGSLMLFQISLTRVFSFSIWHHFAFMIISIALLGFAVSGVALSLRPALAEPPGPRAALYALLFSASAIPAVYLVTRLPFDPTRLSDEPRQMLFLGGYYGALLVPFALARLTLVSLLEACVGRTDRLYGSDLLGAGLGCVAAVSVIEKLGAEGSILATAAGGAVAAALVFPLGFVLGVPFPSAISRLSGTRSSSRLVSWAWAANGSASVLGPIVAVLLALDLGFSWVMLLAALGYGVAYLVFPWTALLPEPPSQAIVANR